MQNAFLIALFISVVLLRLKNKISSIRNAKHIMKWLINYLTSSIGQKTIMTLTGLFLIIFLFVHLIGNFQLFADDGGKSFNLYTQFMSTNPLIQIVAKGLYLFIVIHTIQGILIAIKNRKAKGQKYAVSKDPSGSWASKNMALLGILIFAFLMLHMGDFWFSLKWEDSFPTVSYDNGEVVKDAFSRVQLTFSRLPFVIAYIIGLIALSFHLFHGFESAFQSLGLRHRKYTPIIHFIGIAYSLLVPAAFAMMPLYMYFSKS